jgi:hypothetical protein
LFKNLIFRGGPNLNPGVISIKDKSTLDLTINSFNRYFSNIGISVVRSEIRAECNAVMMKMDRNEVSTYDWLVELMKK